MFVSDCEDLILDDNVDGVSDLLNTNWQTTAAIGLTVATGGVTGALMLTAFPAQTLGAVGGIGALAYAGKRRAEGKSAFPFMDKKSDSEADEAEVKKEDLKAQVA